MNQKYLLLLPIALVGAAALWLAFGSEGDPTLPSAAADVDPTDAAPAVAAAAPEVAEASAGGTLAGNARDAVAIREALLPIPADATWTDLLVVDGESGSPVPGATVLWYDQSITDAVRERELSLPWDQLLWRDHEQAAAKFGWRTTSDANGIARVHRSLGTQVSARHEDRYGHRALGAELVPPRDGFRLELEADFGLDVQVVDAAGRPAAHVPVGLAAHDRQGKFQRLLNWGPMAESTAPDGLARIAHAQKLGAAPEGQHFRACIHLLGIQDEGVPVDLTQPSATPIVLTLPPTGRLRARAEIHGQPVAARWFGLAPRSGNSLRLMFGAQLTRRPDDDGWARFEHVPLGEKLRVSAMLNGSWISQDVMAPVAPGTEVEAVLSPDADRILLAGRLLLPDRSPAAGVHFQLQIDGDAQHHSEQQTDDDGRFQVIAGRADDKNHATAIRFTAQPEGQPPLIAQATPRDLHAGTEDIGDLLLRPDALVVAGRCEIDGEPAKLPAVARVMFQEAREGREPRWRGARNLRLHALDDGRFEFRGELQRDRTDVPPSRLRLEVQSRDHLALDPIEFAPGETNVRVALTRGSDLAATVQMPEGAPQELTATVTPADDGTGRVNARVRGREDGRVQADWSGLPPGTYDLALRIEGITEPLHRISGVVVPPPTGGDPRLIDIDLRELVMTQEIRLSDGDGDGSRRPRWWGGGFFPLGQPPDGDLRGHGCWGEKTKLLLPRGSVPLLVAVHGFRPREVLCKGEPLEVRLDPWPQATVIVEATVELPPGHTLCVVLARLAGDARKYQTQWNSGDLAELLQPPSRTVTVKDGQASLQVGDEPRQLGLQLRSDRRTAEVEIPRRAASVTTPTVRLQVPETALRRAIEQLAKPRNRRQ